MGILSGLGLGSSNSTVDWGDLQPDLYTPSTYAPPTPGGPMVTSTVSVSPEWYASAGSLVQQAAYSQQQQLQAAYSQMQQQYDAQVQPAEPEKPEKKLLVEERRGRKICLKGRK